MSVQPDFQRLRFWTLAGAVIASVLGLYLLGVASFAHQLQSDMQRSYRISPALGGSVATYAPEAGAAQTPAP